MALKTVKTFRTHDQEVIDNKVAALERGVKAAIEAELRKHTVNISPARLELYMSALDFNQFLGVARTDILYDLRFRSNKG